MKGYKPCVASFYDASTGSFTGRVFKGAFRLLEANTPDGQAAMLGLYDHRSQRVDVKTGRVVDYQAPTDAHEELRRRRRKARKEIAKLEQKQLRPMRELSANPNNNEARKRLTAIDEEIVRLRDNLR